MSVLLPETLAVLRTVKALRPLFSNAVRAEEFERKHSFGRYRVSPRTDGKYVVLDAERPAGSRVVDVFDTLDEADAVAAGA